MLTLGWLISSHWHGNKVGLKSCNLSSHGLKLNNMVSTDLRAPSSDSTQYDGKRRGSSALNLVSKPLHTFEFEAGVAREGSRKRPDELANFGFAGCSRQ